jgi:HlyD family secretion protein
MISSPRFFPHLAVPLVALALVVGCGSERAATPPLEQAAKRSFDVIVYTTGEVDAAEATTVSSPIRGDRARIIWIVADGTPVAAGDPIVRFDPSPFEQEVGALEAKRRELEAGMEEQARAAEWELLQAERENRTAEFDLEAAEAAMRRLEKGDGPLELARLESTLLKAQTESEEVETYHKELLSLKEQGLVNQSELALADRKNAEARRAAEVARQQFESYREYVFPSSMEAARAGIARARMTLEQTRRGAEIRAGRAAAERRRLELELEAVAKLQREAALALEHTTLKAPIPGMVVLQEDFRGTERRKPRPGDIALQDRPLVYLPNISRMIARTTIREVDLHQIKAGVPATVTVDAYPGLRLKGAVDFVGIMARDKPGSSGADKFFDVTIAITDTDARLRPGMTARVELLVGAAKDDLSIPVQALFLDGTRTVVYTADGSGRFATRTVELGLVGTTYATVTSGVQPGDQLALAPPALKLIAPLK